jgi:hypothetical protein
MIEPGIDARYIITMTSTQNFLIPSTPLGCHMKIGRIQSSPRFCPFRYMQEGLRLNRMLSLHQLSTFPVRLSQTSEKNLTWSDSEVRDPCGGESISLICWWLEGRSLAAACIVGRIRESSPPAAGNGHILLRMVQNKFKQWRR